MKNLYRAMFLVLLVCVVGTVVFLILSPDRVPMHYNAAGEPDRIGSKYENAIWPLIVAVLSVFFVLVGRRERKKEEKSNEKLLLIVGVCTLALFTLMGFFFLWKAMRYDPEAVQKVAADDLVKFTTIGFGALLVVMGNYMPKAKRNSLIGLRTTWSMANDAVWQKSQRFSGIVSVIAGFVLIILALFVPGMWNTVLLLAVIAVVGILSTVASYRFWRADQKEETT